MNTFDHRLLQIWVSVTVGAGCAIFLAGIVVLLMLTIIGIPLAWLLTLMPGVWIYLTPTVVIYIILRMVVRRTPRLVILVLAAIPPLAAGFYIPWWANKVTEERVKALIAEDHGVPPLLPPGLSYTYAIDRGLGSSGKCWDICQRLLFSRTAQSFIEVPLHLLPMRAALPTPARRFSLGPIGNDCNNTRLQTTYATSEEIGRQPPPPPPLLSDKLMDLGREGLCLHDDSVRDVRSDVIVVQRWNYDPAFRGFNFNGKGWRLSLHPIAPFRRREVFRRTPAGLTRLMRRTEVTYALLAEPLWLSPGFSFDTDTPTHWAWRDHRLVGSPIKSYHPTRWSGIIANDLTVHGLR